jgi:hypothetical protein
MVVPVIWENRADLAQMHGTEKDKAAFRCGPLQVSFAAAMFRKQISIMGKGSLVQA